MWFACISGKCHMKLAVFSLFTFKVDCFMVSSVSFHELFKDVFTYYLDSDFKNPYHFILITFLLNERRKSFPGFPATNRSWHC